MRCLIVTALFIIVSCSAKNEKHPPLPATWKSEVADLLHKQIMHEAAWAMVQDPVTVTAQTSARSAGGKHDYFSEGDYWWPDPRNVHGPYIRRDGITNPNNFVAHRQAMIRFSKIIGALASAYKLTGGEKYILQATKHCNAWFVDTSTLMNANLLFAQAIKGKCTGRGIGIIDTIQLMEVVQGLIVMENSKAIDEMSLEKIRAWFRNYLYWLTTSKYANDEMNAINNHSTCWAMQVAAFAKFTGNKKLLKVCEDRFKNIFLVKQMAGDGSFPNETERTKPYGYSIFNLDAMTTLCQILYTKENNVWKYQTEDGKLVKKGIEFLYPYIIDKGNWPYRHDAVHWNDWPVAQPFLLFGAVAYNNKTWFDTWKKLDHSTTNGEIERNLPIRHVLLWLE